MWLKRGKEYQKGKLTEGEFPDNPFELFKQWFEDQRKLKDDSFHQMVLSTVSQENAPESRVVLLKGFGEKGFVFFSDYRSKKAKSIKSNPRVSLNFLSMQTERQVIIQGKCKKIPAVDSDAYFSTRPRMAQIGSIVSQQSQGLKNRKDLMDAYSNFEEKNKGEKIIRPRFWGGYIVEPLAIEFWQGRECRLNDRIFFTKIKRKWQYQRLYP